MSYDIILGIVKKSWARDEQLTPAAPAAPPPAQLTLTDDEKDKLAKIAALRMKAESGNRKAQKQWKRLSKRAAILGKKARKGDPRAKRMVEVINQSGVLGPAQRISGDPVCKQLTQNEAKDILKTALDKHWMSRFDFNQISYPPSNPLVIQIARTDKPDQDEITKSRQRMLKFLTSHNVDVIEGEFIEPRDQDLIETLILRAGNFAGWPTFISKDRYADYQNRAGKGDQRSKEVLAILNRYITAGKVRVSDEKKGQVISYPIGGRFSESLDGVSFVSDEARAEGENSTSSERASRARQIRSHSMTGSPRQNMMMAQLHLAQRTASASPVPYPPTGYSSSPSPGNDSDMGDRQSDALARQIAMAPLQYANAALLTEALTESPPKAPLRTHTPDLSNQSFSNEIDRQIAEDDARFEAKQALKREQATIAAKNTKEDRKVPLTQKVSTDLLGLMY